MQGRFCLTRARPKESLEAPGINLSASRAADQYVLAAPHHSKGGTEREHYSLLPLPAFTNTHLPPEEPGGRACGAMSLAEAEDQPNGHAASGPVEAAAEEARMPTQSVGGGGPAPAGCLCDHFIGLAPCLV